MTLDGIANGLPRHSLSREFSPHRFELPLHAIFIANLTAHANAESSGGSNQLHEGHGTYQPKLDQ